MSTLGTFFSVMMATIGLGLIVFGAVRLEPIFVAVGAATAIISGFAAWGARMKRPT